MADKACGKSITMLRNVQPINQFLISTPLLRFSSPHVQRSMNISIKLMTYGGPPIN